MTLKNWTLEQFKKDIETNLSSDKCKINSILYFHIVKLYDIIIVWFNEFNKKRTQLIEDYGVENDKKIKVIDESKMDKIKYTEFVQKYETLLNENVVIFKDTDMLKLSLFKDTTSEIIQPFMNLNLILNDMGDK